MLSLQIPKNLIDIISLSHNLGWLFVYKIWLFKDLWRLHFATCRFNCSTNVITGIFSIACCKKHPFSTNTKIILMGTQIHKVLVVFVLPSTTVREVNWFFYCMCVISFKIINNHCLNLMPKACEMIVVIRSKTKWIMLEATIWSQVVYNQGI